MTVEELAPLRQQPEVDAGQSRPAQTGRPTSLSVDLLLMLGLALLLPGLALLPIPLVRVPLGIVAVLVAPGYTLASAIFVHPDDLDGPARAAVSFVISVAVLPLLALILNILPWGIRPWPMVGSLMIWIVTCCGVAAVRRRCLGPVENGGPPALDGVRAWWRTATHARRASIAGAAVGIGVLAWGAVGFLAPAATSRLTEFYVLNADGLAENYPREVAPGQEMELRLGLVNREGARARYRVEARSAGTLLASIDWFTAENGALREESLRYSLPHAGDDQVVDILLFRDDRPTPYRQLRLWVNVTP